MPNPLIATTVPLETLEGVPVQAKAKADLTKEYVASLGRFDAGAGQLAAVLPRYIDDVDRDFPGTYRQMRHSSSVEAGLMVLIDAVLTQGLHITNPIKQNADGYATAAAITALITQNLDILPISIEQSLWESLLALAYGYKGAELVFELLDLDGDGTVELILRAIKHKPQDSYAFVVDSFRNLLGYIPVLPSGMIPSVASILDDPAGMVPPEKMFLFSWHAENSDPRGTSHLRPAYHPWWASRQIWVAYLKFLARFGEPLLVGYTDPEADSEDDDPATAGKSKEQIMLDQLVKMQAGAAGAFPGGARVEMLESKSSGDAFMQAFDLVDREITRVILGQTLSTLEGKHMSRAASQTHQDVFGILVRHIKVLLAEAVREQIIRPLVRFNYGDEAARRYCPLVALGATEMQDFPANAGAVAALLKEGFYDLSQYEALDAFLQGPPRDPVMWAERIARELEIALATAAAAQAGADAAAAGAAGSPAAAASVNKNDLATNQVTSDVRQVARGQSTGAAANIRAAGG